MSITDDMVRDAGRGDTRAIELIYGQLSPAVLGYLTSHRVADPEAVTTDVFLGLLPQLHRVTGGPAGLRTLVFSIAHARVVDEHRRRSRQPAPLQYDPASDARHAPSAETVALDALGAERVHALLSRLTEDQRDVLVLRLIGDLTVEQVASVVDRSTGAVKQLQRRGLVALRELLAGRDVTL